MTGKPEHIDKSSSRVEYCPYCGAYIPEGHSQCLSCGKSVTVLLHSEEANKAAYKMAKEWCQICARYDVEKSECRMGVGKHCLRDYINGDAEEIEAKSLDDRSVTIRSNLHFFQPIKKNGRRDDKLGQYIQKLQSETPEMPTKREVGKIVFPAPRIEGASLKGCIDLRPLAYYKTDLILPGNPRMLKNAQLLDGGVSFISADVYTARTSDGKIARKVRVRVTLNIIGEVDA